MDNSIENMDYFTSILEFVKYQSDFWAFALKSFEKL